MTHRFPIEKAQVSELLPHGPPAMLVDRVLSFDGKATHAQVHISPEWDVFRGHFPDRPILPGVLMIEMVAQTGALIGVLGGMVKDDAFLAFTGIDKARFRRPVVPGETLDLHAELIDVRRNIYRFKGRAECNGVRALSVEFLASPLTYDL
ncbi:3-hydroxyacyl-[acyl-carrier-protein] dehydratase FabZ [Algimonas ampicilliniresistens]|jgi:3-hydroxyacyl-[acyl-carrier-protein] dehydratase|uniref:3-hydroxyacyl-[acyl-carrier-protein] dehydratase FabZ n=1 Tax=Algimonas ampicilliniresistens TaxID=1298735 RepID=A0ABQ5V9T8_9PROT|nr:3-hydroxyacyl-ACP dehydratase FabZ [Algimonas ampicilliniresistens]GLQ23420.1 3-hydroxyacyl-[acyl-carrier-protein] dehydratase FabZ [Algimonas ampicilliniresistens]